MLISFHQFSCFLFVQSPFKTITSPVFLSFQEQDLQLKDQPRTIIDMDGLRVALEYGQKCRKAAWSWRMLTFSKMGMNSLDRFLETCSRGIGFFFLWFLKYVFLRVGISKQVVTKYGCVWPFGWPSHSSDIALALTAKLFRQDDTIGNHITSSFSDMRDSIPGNRGIRFYMCLFICYLYLKYDTVMIWCCKLYKDTCLMFAIFPGLLRINWEYFPTDFGRYSGLTICWCRASPVSRMD